jgi:hypothetical protein
MRSGALFLRTGGKSVSFVPPQRKRLLGEGAVGEAD